MAKFTKELKSITNEALGLACEIGGVDLLTGMGEDDNATKLVGLYSKLTKVTFEMSEYYEDQLEKITSLEKQNKALAMQLEEIQNYLKHLDTKLDGVKEKS